MVLYIPVCHTVYNLISAHWLSRDGDKNNMCSIPTQQYTRFNQFHTYGQAFHRLLAPPHQIIAKGLDLHGSHLGLGAFTLIPLIDFRNQMLLLVFLSRLCKLQGGYSIQFDNY